MTIQSSFRESKTDNRFYVYYHNTDKLSPRRFVIKEGLKTGAVNSLPKWFCDATFDAIENNDIKLDILPTYSKKVGLIFIDFLSAKKVCNYLNETYYYIEEESNCQILFRSEKDLAAQVEALQAQLVAREQKIQEQDSKIEELNTNLFLIVKERAERFLNNDVLPNMPNKNILLCNMCDASGLNKDQAEEFLGEWRPYQGGSK